MEVTPVLVLPALYPADRGYRGFPGISLVGNPVNREASSLRYAWDAAVCNYYVNVISRKD